MSARRCENCRHWILESTLRVGRCGYPLPRPVAIPLPPAPRDGGSDCLCFEGASELLQRDRQTESGMASRVDRAEPDIAGGGR